MKYFLVLFFSIFVFCNEIVISKVNINCKKKETCEYFEKNKDTLKGYYKNINEFITVFEMFYSKDNYSSFSYKVSKNVLTIDIKDRFIVSKVNIKGLSRKVESDLKDDLITKKGNYLDPLLIPKDIELLQKNLKDKGYKKIFIKERIENTSQSKVNVTYYVYAKDQEKILKVNFECEKDIAKEKVETILSKLERRSYDKSLITRYKEESDTTLKNMGFYFADVEIVETKKESGYIYNVSCGDLSEVAFDIQDENKEITKKSLFQELRLFLKSTGKRFSEGLVNRFINRYLASKGYPNRAFVIEDIGSDVENKKFFKRIIFKKSDLKKIDSVRFRGNKTFSTKYLEKMFYSQTSINSEKKVWDESQFKAFKKFLYKEYISSGYLQNEITVISNTTKSSVIYDIKEGDQTKVSQIEVINEEGKQLDSVVNKFKTAKGDPFNPIIFEEDFNFLRRYFLDQGYYWFRVINTDDDVVSYSNNNKNVKIKIKVFQGSKALLRSFDFFGLENTKRIVPRRALEDLQDEYVSPDLIKEIRQRISNLNLFKNSQIEIAKLDNDSEDVRALIKFEEKEYGQLEIAPGFRTDLGLKFGARYTRENLFGLNQTLDAQANTNYRLNLEDLDDHPKRQLNKFPEFSFKTSYSYPDLLRTKWDNFTAASFSRARLFDFDADILRLSNSIKRDFNRYFGMNITYSYESIVQSNASPNLNSGLSDEGAFQIGSLTPSLIFDFRDNPVNPRKGAWFQFSYEWAKSFLGSQSGEKNCSFAGPNCDPEINFGKFVSRSKFYIPITKRFFIASSLAFGLQTNYATEKKLAFPSESTGFIPSIKVFRLSGVDIVRGYKEREINLINQTSDIADLIVDKTAFMTNLKFEPRYLLNDSMILGVFLDAGSIQVNSYNPFALRTSTGLSFKYLTPVGSIDLDYGFKLKRRNLPSGQKESPGEFRLSIGFF